MRKIQRIINNNYAAVCGFLAYLLGIRVGSKFTHEKMLFLYMTFFFAAMCIIAFLCEKENRCWILITYIVATAIIEYGKNSIFCICLCCIMPWIHRYVFSVIKN